MLNDVTQQHALLLVEKLAAFAMLIVSLEYLPVGELLQDGGTMSWAVARLRQAWLTKGRISVALNSLLKYPNVYGVLIARALLAFLVLIGFDHPSVIVAITLLSLLFLVRSPYGHDGADQMLLIIFIGLSLRGLADTPLTRAMLLWFLAFQACLSYCVAGIAKSSAKGWRDGAYLVAICGTFIYGHTAVARFLRDRPKFTRVVSRSLIFWECSFPLAMLLPLPAAYAILAAGLIFHLVNAYVMGLNTFLFAFAATYPAILFCLHHRGI